MAPPLQSTAGPSPSVSCSPRSAELISIQMEGAAPSGEVKIEPSGKFKQFRTQIESCIEKSAEMRKASRDEMREAFYRLDPKGFLSCMMSVSLFYAAFSLWLLWRVADQPPALFWTFSLLVCSLIFLWTIVLSVTMSVPALFFRMSYIILLAFSATHLIGPVNGMVIMFLGLFYAAGVLGYAAAEHCQRVGIERSADAAVLRTFADERQREGYEGWTAIYGFIFGVLSLVILVRMAYVILIPNTAGADLLELLAELPGETLMLSSVYALYVAAHVLNGALVSMYALHSGLLCFAACFFFGGFLSCVMPTKLVGLFVVWLTSMAAVGFVGYAAAVRERYMQIQTRLKSELPTSQEFDEAYQKPKLQHVSYEGRSVHAVNSSLRMEKKIRQTKVNITC